VPALGAEPAAQEGRIVEVREREQQRQLRPVREVVAGEQRERVDVERGEQLVVGEPQTLLEQARGGGAQNSWFSPPKTSETESSVKIRRIESVSRSAQLRTVMLSGAPGRSGIVSVMTMRSK
jgi:hypothetical protein